MPDVDPSVAPIRRVQIIDSSGSDATGATPAQVGVVTETAPATDTASSGLNGRLQRIAQRLTSLIAQIPASLGIKTAALSLSVAPASDGVFAVSATGVTYIDSSVTNATGSSQQLLAANTARKALTIIAPITETTSWVINPMGTTAVSGTRPCFTLNPGDEWSPDPCPTNKITAIGTATATLTVLEG
jgi:hypothetical protein